MKNQTILLATSIAMIIGIALVFLGIVTYLDPGLYHSEVMASRNRAYVEIAFGFIFIATGIVVFMIYGEIEATRKLLRTYEQRPNSHAKN